MPSSLVMTVKRSLGEKHKNVSGFEKVVTSLMQFSNGACFQLAGIHPNLVPWQPDGN